MSSGVSTQLVTPEIANLFMVMFDKVGVEAPAMPPDLAKMVEQEREMLVGLPGIAQALDHVKSCFREEVLRVRHALRNDGRFTTAGSREYDLLNLIGG